MSLIYFSIVDLFRCFSMKNVQNCQFMSCSWRGGDFLTLIWNEKWFEYFKFPTEYKLHLPARSGNEGKFSSCFRFSHLFEEN